LREYIEQHNKKCEEYTAKLLRDQQQAKKSWGQQIQNQIATKAAKKKADAFRDQKQERYFLIQNLFIKIQGVTLK